MGSGATAGEFNINVPFDIDMLPNHAYLFRLTVESLVVKVHYRAAEWEDGSRNDFDLGENDSGWIELGTWSGPDGWTEHTTNGSNEDIGNE
jgi:hypothetical protein